MSFYLHLPVLIIVFSLVYSATRFDDWEFIWRETGRWCLRLTSFLLVIGGALYVMSRLF